MSKAARKELVELSQKLPPSGVQEVLHFATILLTRDRTPSAPVNDRRDGSLRSYIGGVKHGGLASGIDDARYGTRIHRKRDFRLSTRSGH